MSDNHNTEVIWSIKGHTQSYFVTITRRRSIFLVYEVQEVVHFESFDLGRAMHVW